MPGPPFPGESVTFYDGTEVYWDIVPAAQVAQYPPTLKFTAKNGAEVKINRLTGAIIP
jgi:hypothetical protein